MELPDAPEKIDLSFLQEAESKATPVFKKRTLEDLPCSINKAVICMAVVSFELYGLNDTDIANSLNISVSKLNQLRQSDEFTQIRDDVVNSVANKNQDEVAAIFEQNLSTAAHEIIAALNSENEGRKLKAAEQILNLGGFQPQNRKTEKAESLRVFINVQGGQSTENIGLLLDE